MKYFYLLFFVGFLTGCFSQKITVRYELKQTQPYCGGARPTQEILEKAKVPQPYANKTLIFVSQKGKIDSVTTNADGLFSKKLDKGIYNFYEPWKYHKQTPDGSSIDNYDKSCLEKEWKHPDLIIVVKKTKSEITNNIATAKCFWNISCLIKKQTPP